MPSKKPTPDAPFPNKLIDRVLAKIDLDALTDSLTEQTSQKLLAAVNIDKLTPRSLTNTVSSYKKGWRKQF